MADTRVRIRSCALQEPQTLGPRWDAPAGNWLVRRGYDALQQVLRYSFFPANSYDLHFAISKSAVLREVSPDLIYGMSIGVSNSLAALVRSAGSVPVLVDLDDYIIRESNPMLRLFTGMTVASEGLRERFQELDPFYLPNCGDMNLFDLGVAPKKREGNPEIIWHGIMYPELTRSFFQFCEGLRLADLNVGFTVLCRGSPTVVDQLRSAGIGRTSVRVESWVPRSSLPQRLSQASVGVVLPLANPVYENLRSPGKLLDYMASGLPVLCPSYGEACRIVVKSGCGIPIAFDRPQEVAHAVRKLVSDPALREEMGRKGREFLRESHNMRTIVPQLLKYVAKKWNSGIAVDE